MQNLVNIVHRDMVNVSFPIAVKIRVGEPHEFPEYRDHAYTFQSEDGDLYVVVSDKLIHSQRDRIQAIMRHELAHAWFLNEGNEHHSERDTDNLAEELWGDRLYYDDDDIQTLNPDGTYPRPSYLPQ